MPLVLRNRNTPYIGAANWWTVWDLAYQEFVSSVNTIPIKVSCPLVLVRVQVHLHFELVSSGISSQSVQNILILCVT